LTTSLAGHLRAGRRFATFLVVSLVFAAVFVLTIPLPRRVQLRVQRVWSAAVAWSAALDVKPEGETVSGPGSVLYLANHVSYFDIPAIGSLLDAAFVAKSEVASWPIFGWCARLTGTLFIPRRAGRSAEQVRVLRARLLRGENLILFPEGTNSDGTGVLPFKSSLLASAAPEATGLPVTIQPVSLAYTRTRDGAPLTGDKADLYAWVGADDMFPHLWRALAASGAEVRVIFHPPLDMTANADRKALTRAAEAAVRDGVARLWAATAAGSPPAS
jgi:1-acyl-sn-glycerol-3-phosphate acyltransferase